MGRSGTDRLPLALCLPFMAIAVAGALFADTAIAAEQIANRFDPVFERPRPRVVVSIRPLEALAAAVLSGVSKPVLIVQGTGSEHNYALRPSDAAALDRADVVVWIGPGLETFLAKPVRALGGKARVVTISELGTFELLPARMGGGWGEHDDAPGEASGGFDANPGAGKDMHVWLNPENAKAIVSALANEFATVDPERGDYYRQHASRYIGTLGRLDLELRAQLMPVRRVPYLVFHDAYQYFEARYGLQPIGSLTVSPERRPGAKRFAELRQRILTGNAACVFYEPQFDASLVTSLTQGTHARTAALDPLGSTVAIKPGTDAYLETMRGLANSLRGCLSTGSAP